MSKNLKKQEWLKKHGSSMKLLSPISKDLVIGKPLKVTIPQDDLLPGATLAGKLILNEGDGIKRHTHTDDSETYFFEDGRVETCNPGESHEIKPGLRQIVGFCKFIAPSDKELTE
ncbi:MAG: hypothetical protein FWC00_01710 [Firmicutes bacterium]|nr:hypothetical protein [Bacillota bacterium]